MISTGHVTHDLHQSDNQISKVIMVEVVIGLLVYVVHWAIMNVHFVCDSMCRIITILTS